VLDLLKKLARESGVTIIMALHDLNLAAQYCDQIILLNKGRIYKSGQPEEVITGRTVKDIYGAGSIVFPHPLIKSRQLFQLPVLAVCLDSLTRSSKNRINLLL